MVPKFAQSLTAVLIFPMMLAASPAAPSSQTAPAIAEDDYQRLVNLESPVISPDGKSVVVLVSRVAWNEDRHDDELVSIDLTTHSQRTLVSQRKDLSDPAFSPDGSRLAFIAEEGKGDNAGDQVFVMPLDGSADARAVTHVKDGVDQFAWRPDGAAIAYVSADGAAERTGADRFRDSFVFTTEPIVARHLPDPAHLFLLSLQNGETTQLTAGSQSVATGEGQSTLSWAPDGKTLAFTLTPNAILNDESYSRVALVDVTTRSQRALTPHAAWEGNPLFSPDGKHVAYLYSDGDPQVNLTELYVTSPSGGAGTALAVPDGRTIDDVAWAPDSQSLYVKVPEDASVALYRVPLQGNPQRVDLGPLNVASDLVGTIGPQGSLVFVASATKQPPELYAYGGSAAPQKLTGYNAPIAGLSLASAERITFPTTTGIRGDGVLFTPPDFSASTKYPLVVFIHGGPTSQSALTFDFWAQLMAARGWLVVRPNYRGSTDRGLAYQRAVLYDPEAGPGKDIMAAVAAVRARGIVDDSRVAVCGWSYGGIMTAWMISKYHIWKAAVSGASVNDWITDYGTADDSLADADLFHGSPFLRANTSEWREASAITYAADVTTPVLILSDVGDNRDPFATSSMYWRALRDNHKDATLRVWPVNGHFPRDPVRTVDVYHYWIDFIAQHFK
jgi:dipeptidyl aminopeptidase/acylaminoacyl peptidase